MTQQTQQIIKSDKELLKIWNLHQKKTQYWWMYNQLTSEEKSRIFELLK